MILNEQDAVYASNKFINYFSNIHKIDDYLRLIKLDRMKNFSSSLPGQSSEDEMFSSFDMHPQDMDFEVYEIDNDVFNNYLEITTSHAIEKSIPGKTLKWIVKEKNTNKIVGFIRFGSPLINSKPRNEFLGQVPNLSTFNKNVIMGFIIVPTQPFGYNYLGGKLLTLICCSHKARNTLNKKYDDNICLFETTSLYGSTKSISQYDGLKPYLRYKGLTNSNFIPLLHDNAFLELDSWFKIRNGNKSLIQKNASSRKLKTQQMMISIIKSSLKDVNNHQLIIFENNLNRALNLTEQKRFYMSDYGFSNVREVINGKTDKLIKNSQNYDKFYIENLIKWWKNKSSARYELLKSEGRLRTELELWNKNIDIDIIR